MRVLVAPDSFKGSATAAEIAESIRRGWLDVRPKDTVVLLPLADNGEGTLDAVEAASPGTMRQVVPVDGPGSVDAAPWLLHEDGTAIVELAAACGLPMWPSSDPLGAHTLALGQVLRAAAEDPRVGRIVVAVGGSASTDGGTGALVALGAAFRGIDSSVLALGELRWVNSRTSSLTNSLRLLVVVSRFSSRSTHRCSAPSVPQGSSVPKRMRLPLTSTFSRGRWPDSQTSSAATRIARGQEPPAARHTD